MMMAMSVRKDDFKSRSTTILDMLTLKFALKLLLAVIQNLFKTQPITPSTERTNPFQIDIVCTVPLANPNTTSAAKLNANVTAKLIQNFSAVYMYPTNGTLKYATNRLIGRKRIVTFVRSSVRRVKRSPSRDSLMAMRVKFSGMRAS